MKKNRLRALIDAAKHARQKAYCPYSRFPVGAAVLTESGRIFAGCNVENASYGLCICAERSAVFNAAVHGERGLKAVCVVGKSPRPCGACRQVLLEFSTKETDLFIVDLGQDARHETIIRTKVAKMLPLAFDPFEAGILPPNPQNLLKRRRSPDKKPRRRGAKKR